MTMTAREAAEEYVKDMMKLFGQEIDPGTFERVVQNVLKATPKPTTREAAHA